MVEVFSEQQQQESRMALENDSVMQDVEVDKELHHKLKHAQRQQHLAEASGSPGSPGKRAHVASPLRKNAGGIGAGVVNPAPGASVSATI